MGVASGALVPDSGVVTIDGTSALGDPKKTRELGLAIVRQEPSLMPDLTVAENMFLGLPLHLRPPISTLTGWANGLLAAWGKEGTIRADELVAALNPEKRFIVEIAKALAAKPKVLILDEPTEHLLSDDVERLFARVREVAAGGTAVVYISHRIREVRRIAQRVTVLRDGACQGTFDTAAVDEKRIVELIVGGTLDHEYPAKGADIDARPTVLEVSRLSGKGFRDVSLKIRRGEVIGLAGIDANGQREFVRALAGLSGISEGSVVLNGKPVRISGPSSAAGHGIGYLPGDRHREGILAELSVRENFAIRSISRDTSIGFINGLSEARRAGAAVEAFAVKTPTLDTPISSLSGGNQQKLILASVLAANPTVLIVDEPTQGVDVGARAEIYRILRKIAAEGTAIIIVSSDAAEVSGLCERVLVFSSVVVSIVII
jgi:ribose transport system ATP-binding protein